MKALFFHPLPPPETEASETRGGEKNTQKVSYFILFFARLQEAKRKEADTQVPEDQVHAITSHVSHCMPGFIFWD
jgi:hypothetical protein